MTQEQPDDLEGMIIYEDRKPFGFSCRSSGTDLKDTIRYWLGKSPGMYRDEIEKIIVFSKGAVKDCTEIISKLNEEQYEREQEYRERAERAEYLRLKEKYDK